MSNRVWDEDRFGINGCYQLLTIPLGIIYYPGSKLTYPCNFAGVVGKSLTLSYCRSLPWCKGTNILLPRGDLHNCPFCSSSLFFAPLNMVGGRGQDFAVKTSYMSWDKNHVQKKYKKIKLPALSWSVSLRKTNCFQLWYL